MNKVWSLQKPAHIMIPPPPCTLVGLRGFCCLPACLQSWFWAPHWSRSLRVTIADVFPSWSCAEWSLCFRSGLQTCCWSAATGTGLGLFFFLSERTPATFRLKEREQTFKQNCVCGFAETGPAGPAVRPDPDLLVVWNWSFRSVPGWSCKLEGFAARWGGSAGMWKEPWLSKLLQVWTCLDPRRPGIYMSRIRLWGIHNQIIIWELLKFIPAPERLRNKA